MSKSFGSDKSTTDLLCKDSSAALAESMATLSFGGTDTDSSAFRPFKFSFPPASDAPTSPFGSSSSVSSSPLFGVSSTPASGTSSSPLFGVPSASASGISISPLFGVPSASASGAKSSLFGAPNVPVSDVSFSPLFGPSITLASSGSDSQLFGAPTTSASSASSCSLFGASNKPATAASGFAFSGTGISPLFGECNKPAFGASSSPLFDTSNTHPFRVSNKLGFGAPSNPFATRAKPAFTSCSGFGTSGNSGHCSFGTPPYCASHPPFNTTTPFPLVDSNSPAFSASVSPFDASSTPAFGAFTRTTTPGFAPSATPAFGSTFGGFSTRPFEGLSGPYFGVPCSSCGARSSHVTGGFTSWSPFWKDPIRLRSFRFAPARLGFKMEKSQAVADKTAFNCDDNRNIVSISGTLACNNINMSHEELRWIEYCRRDNKDVIRIIDTESDLISIRIEISPRAATQLLDALASLSINVDSSSTSHSMFSTPFSDPTRREFSFSQSGQQPYMPF